MSLQAFQQLVTVSVIAICASLRDVAGVVSLFGATSVGSVVSMAEATEWNHRRGLYRRTGTKIQLCMKAEKNKLIFSLSFFLYINLLLLQTKRVYEN